MYILSILPSQGTYGAHSPSVLARPLRPGSVTMSELIYLLDPL